MNKIIVIGNLGRDPEMRYTPNGQAVTSFSVASNRKYTTSTGEKREETEWFNVSAWGKLGLNQRSPAEGLTASQPKPMRNPGSLGDRLSAGIDVELVDLSQKDQERVSPFFRYLSDR